MKAKLHSRNNYASALLLDRLFKLLLASQFLHCPLYQRIYLFSQYIFIYFYYYKQDKAYSRGKAYINNRLILNCRCKLLCLSLSSRKKFSSSFFNLFKLNLSYRFNVRYTEDDKLGNTSIVCMACWNSYLLKIMCVGVSGKLDQHLGCNAQIKTCSGAILIFQAIHYIDA